MKLPSVVFAAIVIFAAVNTRAQTPAPVQAAKRPAAGQISAPAAAAPVKPAKKPGRARRKPAAARPAGVDPKKVNSLLYGTMERLETLSALYENLGLRVSTGTLKKAYELDKAVNKAAAPYFRIAEPGAEREGLKNYRGLLESVLRSVRILKEIKGRLKPAATESAILAARDLYQAMDTELAGPKLTSVVIEPRPRAGKTGPAAGSGATASSSTGEDLANETETLVAVSEVTFALSAYRREEGKFPAHLENLSPKYLPALPAVEIADHPKTAEVVEIDSTDYDLDYTKAFRDTGKWLYFSHKKSRYHGRVFVDCSHKDAQGLEFYRIGEKK
ncbi:MAG: hypothetical protein A2X28_09370 [Elusimicrobia bacterium GWA2_56_46]|nr:MAG: hypothetical protein A2X28_09370 [Elusimicrobia bacterium GWA2_56_46]OGR55574.1 MAG: hypothetical protein A2X39_08600 [Elusimicrobia bacterium GWC2_56_31]HBB67458.1 hypothetical protein [Elusimicrobiota bacterium]HBW22020.1 hypothetical protein [Elusimicrobiota bacterium]